MPGNLRQQILRPRDLFTHNLIGLSCQIEMVPGVVADFVPVFGDRLGALEVSLRPVSSDEKRAVHMRAFKGRDQVFEAFRVGAGVKGKRDL